MLNANGMIIWLIQYVPKPCSCFGWKVELNLSFYETKDAAGVDILLFAKSIDLVNLQLDKDKLDIPNLKTAPTCSDRLISDSD